MQHYLTVLELKIRNNDIPKEHRSSAQKEIEDLITKIDRRRKGNFDFQGFLDTQKKFKKIPEYRKEVEERIAGTWIKPVKEKDISEVPD
jgi:hypothetical protein